MEFLVAFFSILSVGLAVILMLLLVLFRNNRPSRRNRIYDNLDELSPYRRDNMNRKAHNEKYAKLKDKHKEQEHFQENSVSQRTAVQKYDPHGMEAVRDLDDGQIVDVVKPVGFWTRFIMSQKMQYILMRLGAQAKHGKGGWVTRIKAQAGAQGKTQGRGR